MWDQYPEQIKNGDTKSISRCISLIENRVEGYEVLLQSLVINEVPVIGITGPPGAGKSTLADALIQLAISDDKKVAVLCVDPASPFTLGSLLGDRIRMNKWFAEPSVYIRSLSTRGSLGGLNPMIIEITDLLRASNFDLIIIETVGIGQSEIEIAGIADVTLVVLVPEAGDDIQAMKAGLMEIADIFVINKTDRPGADIFVGNLKTNIPSHTNIPIIKVVASEQKGIDVLYKEILQQLETKKNSDKKFQLLVNKAYQLIQHERMIDIDAGVLKKEIEDEWKRTASFNLYRFVQKRSLLNNL